jgi:hypothetical protein
MIDQSVLDWAAVAIAAVVIAFLADWPSSDPWR